MPHRVSGRVFASLAGLALATGISPLRAQGARPDVEAESLGPVLVTQAPPEAITHGEARRVTIRFSRQEGTSAEFRWVLDDRDPVVSANGYADLTELDPGPHVFRVQVKLVTGDWSRAAAVDFRVLANQRPRVDFGTPAAFDPLTSAGPLAIVLTGDDPDGRIVAWRLAIDREDQFVQQDHPDFALAAPADGTHKLWAQAIDDEGAASTWRGLPIVVTGGALTGFEDRSLLATRTSRGASRWMKGADAPDVAGLEMLGLNEQGCPEYALPLGGGDRMTLVLVPAGAEWHASDGEVHKARLPAFLMAKTECTRAQWQAVMGRPRDDEPRPDVPIHDVRPDRITTFLKRAKLELPTEDEWEYAARAGVLAELPSRGHDMQWRDLGSGTNRPHAVGRDVPNAFGMHEILGNVWECTADTRPNRPASLEDDGLRSAFFARGGSIETGGDLYVRRTVVPGHEVPFVGFRPVRRLR
ncbi:MAG: SUMF1/EgtB/PvdO family nonheme iron enzyme [Planctomycetes bacterium]|nr:SUMF1/EgtB/PvdO family nonheme iron enzyme [Planctomycetota bacterium]